ncbi:hypothetical protein BH18ACI2_BH18ACI2_11550 [soil metagenome]
MKNRIAFLACALLFLIGPFIVRAQETKTLEANGDEVLHVNTRVVFLDTLVREKRTGVAVSDLKLENFEVRADGRRREVSYFAREGDKGRRPLALTLIFDLRQDGAGRFMRRADILAAMAAELSKLPPADEVAVVVVNARGTGEDHKWLTRFTRERAQTTIALAAIPALVPEKNENDSGDSGHASRATLKADDAEQMETQLEDIDKAHRGEAGEGDETEEIVDKKGNRVTRVVKPDGTVLIRRVNKDGSTTVDLSGASDLPRLTREITRLTAQERPHSQAAVVYITDGIVPIFYAERDYVETKMLRSNVIFNALVTDMKTVFKFLLPVVKPLGNWVGLSIAGSAQHLAKRTGGESLKVRRPTDYASGLRQVIGNLNARYSLGFTLAETETDDGQQQHTLEVKVRARDAKGKDRKLEVKARGGYYLPAAEKKSEEVKKETVNR